MHVTPSGRGPQVPSAAAARKDAQRLTEHVDRKLSSLRIPPASGGGPLGMVEVWSTADTVTATAGASTLNYAAVTYQAPYDPNASTEAAASFSWLTVSGYELMLEEGWYIPVMYQRLSWASGSDTPESFGAFMGGGYDSPHNDVSTVASTRTSTSTYGLQAWFNYGPTFVPAGGSLHAECRFTPVLPAGIVTANSRIGWAITKWT